MEGTIAHFVGGRHTQKGNQMVIVPKESKSKEDSEKLVEKKVTWKSSSGKEIKGEVRSTHGNKGNIRVLFESGMPGQSIGTNVKIE